MSFRFVLLGCTDSAATNFREVANLHDNSCKYVGCLESDALNFDPTATVAGACVDKIVGCMTLGAHNYRQDANVPNGVPRYPFMSLGEAEVGGGLGEWVR